MLNHPLENSAIFNLNWVQQRPIITQRFGLNPGYYAKYGMDGHNGEDYRAAIGTPIFAPIAGMLEIKDSGKSGYGLHAALRCPWPTPLELKFGHLSKIDWSKHGKILNAGDLIGYTGNSGDSTGPHLHLGLRFLLPSEAERIEFIINPTEQIFDWPVKNYNNGKLGYVDHNKKLYTGKGDQNRTTLAA